MSEHYGPNLFVHGVFKFVHVLLESFHCHSTPAKPYSLLSRMVDCAAGDPTAAQTRGVSQRCLHRRSRHVVTPAAAAARRCRSASESEVPICAARRAQTESWGAKSSLGAVISHRATNTEENLWSDVKTCGQMCRLSQLCTRQTYG